MSKYYILALVMVATVFVYPKNTSAKPSSQPSGFDVVYSADVYIPAGQEMYIDLPGSQYLFARVFCTGSIKFADPAYGGHYGWFDCNDGQNHDQYPQSINNTSVIRVWIINRAGEGNDATGHATIWGYRNPEYPTALPTDTAIPASPTSPPTSPTTAINPTSPGGGGGSGGGTGSGCGITPFDPCYVQEVKTPAPIIFPTQAPVTGDVSVNNFPTPMPTATLPPSYATALAVAANPPQAAPVPYSQTQGEMSMLPVENEGDTWTAGFKTEVYNFGCPIDVNSWNIKAKICISYTYVKALYLLGINLPLDIIIGSMLVLVILYIIKRR